MPPSDSLVSLQALTGTQCLIEWRTYLQVQPSFQESFCLLRALLSYASNDSGNESSLYGAVSFILTLFCSSSKVTSTKFENLYLGSFPQKDLKVARAGKNFRAPDFTILAVQSVFDQKSVASKIGDMGPLIWEVKASPEAVGWFGEEQSERPKLNKFFPHFPQIAAQVAYAKVKFNRKPIYTLLSIDIWFVLLHFPGDPPAIPRSGIKKKPPLDPMDVSNFYRYMIVPPAPIINEDCTAFSPEFLYALQTSFRELVDVTVTPHQAFRAPDGIEEYISTQLKQQDLGTTFEGEGRRAEIENKFALGEEDSDERWSSTIEETETDLENQKYPAAAPATLRHFPTSPRMTRSKTATLGSRAATAEASDQPEASNAENAAGLSRTDEIVVAVRLESPWKADAVRPRRKAPAKACGSQKKNN